MRGEHQKGFEPGLPKWNLLTFFVIQSQYEEEKAGEVSTEKEGLGMCSEGLPR